MDEFDEIREQIPFESPIKPERLTLQSEFRFNCHPGIRCFNACCRNIDITLTPYDVVRLKRRLGLTSGDFVARFTTPFEMDSHGLPGLKLATVPESNVCAFLRSGGCSVYEDRPAACRYYALGNMGVRSKGLAAVEEVYFVVREPHCLGHEEPVTQTVAEYREDQEVDVYDEMNREWRDIIIKKRSSGPAVGAPSPRSLQLFDMCSYDMDSFREFLRSPGFQSIFDLDGHESHRLVEDEDGLLQFSFRFLKQVLFGEFTIPRRDQGREMRIEERKAIWRERKEAGVRAFQEQRGDSQYAGIHQCTVRQDADDDAAQKET